MSLLRLPVPPLRPEIGHPILAMIYAESRIGCAHRKRRAARYIHPSGVLSGGVHGRRRGKDSARQGPTLYSSLCLLLRVLSGTSARRASALLCRMSEPSISSENMAARRLNALNIQLSKRLAEATRIRARFTKALDANVWPDLSSLSRPLLRGAMSSSTSRLIAAVVMTLTVTGCGGDGNRTIPTATAPTSTPAPTPAPGSTFALFGVVSEVTANGVMPIEGVQVEEYHRHQFSTTDANGSYHISGVSVGTLGVGFEHAGYQSSRSIVYVNGDTRFDIQAIRR